MDRDIPCGARVSGSTASAPEEEALIEDEHLSSVDLEGHNEAEDDDPAWRSIVQDSLARRPAWRRPNAAWIFPVVIFIYMTSGLGAAPKFEIYVNLVCQAHPPHVDNLLPPANESGGMMGRL